MAVLRVCPLPEDALAAAARFHIDVLPEARAISPLPNGEGARAAPSGEDLVLIFPPAPPDHRGWRLAAVRDMARAAAPFRVNGIAGDDDAAIAATLAFLENAPGVTGQLLSVEPARSA